MVEPEFSYHPLAPDALAVLIRLLAGEPISSLHQKHNANGVGEHTGSTVPDALCCLERLINNLDWISPTLDWLLNAVRPSVGRWQQTQPSLWCMPQPRGNVPADVLETLPANRFGFPGHDILLTTSWHLNDARGSTDPIIDFGYAFHFDARTDTTRSAVRVFYLTKDTEGALRIGAGWETQLDPSLDAAGFLGVTLLTLRACFDGCHVPDQQHMQWRPGYRRLFRVMRSALAAILPRDTDCMDRRKG